MKLLNVILEFLLYIFLLSLLGAPLVLIVRYPFQAEYFTRFAETMIPWGVALFLAAIFNQGIKTLFTKITEKINDLTSVSAGGVAFELNKQRFESVGATEQQIQENIDRLNTLSRRKEKDGNIAITFHNKYIFSTIYGSQFALLEASVKSPLFPAQASVFYNKFTASAPEASTYSFDKWMGYLITNYLITYESNTGLYKITDIGKNLFRQYMTRGLKQNHSSTKGQ